MSNVRKCAIAGVAALAAGAGAYLAMPAGRALTEQEKRETWGGSYSCSVCVVGGGQGYQGCKHMSMFPTYELSEKSTFSFCTGQVGLGAVRIANVTTDASVTIKEDCKLTSLKTKKENGKWVWTVDPKNTGPNAELCGRLSECETNDAADPEACKEPGKE